MVIVGVAAESVQDYFETPFSTGFNTRPDLWNYDPADQLIRQALDSTPSLYGLSRPLENVWIWLWALAATAEINAARLALGNGDTVSAIPLLSASSRPARTVATLLQPRNGTDFRGIGRV